MKALSIVLVVMVVALTGFSVWQFIEAREVKAELADMKAETQSVAAELVELKSTLVDVFEFDMVQATNTRKLIHYSLLMAINMSEWSLAISQHDWAKVAEYRGKYEDARDTYDLTREYHGLVSEAKLALLTGSED